MFGKGCNTASYRLAAARTLKGTEEAHPVQELNPHAGGALAPKRQPLPSGPLSEGRRSRHTKAGRMAPPLKVLWGKSCFPDTLQ